MLKAQILNAVASAKSAVEDLAVQVSHVRRGPAVPVPGAAPTYAETLTLVKVVWTRFKSSEVDGNRVMASDWRGLIFPETNLPPLNPNDIIRVPTGLTDITSGDYRILDNDKVIAGDTVALHQLQLRKL